MTPPARPLTLLTLLTVGLLTTGLTAPPGAAGADDGVRPPKPPRLTVDEASPPLRISFISYANPQHVAKNSAAIAKYLEPYVGVPVKGFVTTDYGSSVETIRSGKTDLAFVDPLSFLMAY